MTVFLLAFFPTTNQLQYVLVELPTAQRKKKDAIEQPYFCSVYKKSSTFMYFRCRVVRECQGSSHEMDRVTRSYY